MADNLIKSVFNMFDKDGNGTIDKSELRTVLKNVEGLRGIQLAAIMTKADADKSGSVDFEEFKKFVIPELSKTPLPVGDIDAAFKKYDKNGDGFLTADEICTVSGDLGYQLTPSQAKDLISLSDLNSDGKISLDEFKKLI